MFDSLRWRLIISHVVVLLMAVVLAGAAFFFLVGGYRNRLSTATLREVAAPVAFQVSRAQRVTDIGPLLRFLREQATATHVGAVIVDSDGLVVADVNPAETALLGDQFALPPVAQLPARLDQLYRGSHTTKEGRELDFIAIPLPQNARVQSANRSGEATAGAVILFLPSASAGDLVWNDLGPRLLLAAAAGLGAALLVGLVLGRWIYRPLATLRGATFAVSSGDLSTQVTETGPRETRDLARDFNRMTNEIAVGRSALQDFLIDASHELRTPLTSVRGFSQALVDGTIVSDAERIRAAEIIQRETDRLLRLVSELSDLARLESGQARLELVSVDVTEVLEDVAETFEPGAGAASARIEVVAEPDLPPVLVDRDRLTQIVANLVDNAVRHVGQGGQVRVSGRRSGAPFVEIAVADDGPGIAEADLGRVFERFYRGSRGNSGVGLAICRELVRAHNGTIWAESEPGVGTRFVFTLPVAPSPATGTTPA